MKIQRYKRGSEVSYTLGITLTIELLVKRPDNVTEVFIHPDFTDGESKSLLLGLCKARGTPVTVGEKAFNILSQKENCFAIGQFRVFSHEISQNTSHLVLVNPSNAGNLGTIMRTAVGFGTPDIAIVTPAADPFDPKTVRASMGAIFAVNVEEFTSFEEYDGKFGGHAYYPFMLNAKHKINEVEFKEPCALIFGNEATGLPDSFDSFTDSVVIPHGDGIDSLNLPIAVGIGLFKYGCRKFN